MDHTKNFQIKRLMLKMTTHNPKSILAITPGERKKNKHIKELIPRLIDQVLGPSEYGDYYILTLSALSKALNNMGVPSKVLSLEYTFSPEKWLAPSYIDAISIDKVIYGGEGRTGWDCLIELQRKKNNIKDDYIDKQKITHITFDDFVQANAQNNILYEEEIHTEVARCQSIIDEFIFEHLTPQAGVKSKKRLRL